MPVYYRGDHRPPEVIFKEGFSSQTDLDIQKPLNSYPIKINYFDAEPEIGVSCSMDWRAAAFFPEPRREDSANDFQSYLYALWSDDDLGDMVDFNRDSLTDTLNDLKNVPLNAPESAKIISAFITLEWVKEVKLRGATGNDILFGLKLKRKCDHFGGIVSFSIVHYEKNSQSFHRHNNEMIINLQQQFSTFVQPHVDIDIPSFYTDKQENVLWRIFEKFRKAVNERNITDPETTRMLYEATLASNKDMFEEIYYPSDDESDA